MLCDYILILYRMTATYVTANTMTPFVDEVPVSKQSNGDSEDEDDNHLGHVLPEKNHISFLQGFAPVYLYLLPFF